MDDGTQLTASDSGSRTKPDNGDRVWSPVTVKRASGPPLRFKGQLLTTHLDGGEGAAAAIRLWRRKTPGFVVSVSWAGIEDGYSSASIEEVAAWIEDYCMSRSDTTVDIPTSMEALLQQACDRAAAWRTFRVLAGEALALWTDDVAMRQLERTF